MSTLKAARADNFYYPPDEATWSEQRQRMRKTQKRARNYFKSSSLKYSEAQTTDDGSVSGTDSGSLTAFSKGTRRGTVIRFEMPFKVICLKCNGYIAKGVRFDAERKAVGNYHSTTIYAFLMSCQYCHNPIVIQTDPKNTEYLCKVGIRKKVEEFDTSDAQTAELGLDHATKQEMLSNPLFKLECMALKERDGSKEAETPRTIDRNTSEYDQIRERSKLYQQRHEARDGHLAKDPLQIAQEKAELNKMNDKLEELLRINEINSGDWYLANSALRKKFREEKKSLQPIANFSLELAKEREEDIKEAKRITFASQSKEIRSHFKRILKKDSDMFSRTCASSSCSGQSTLDKKRRKLQFIKHIDSRLRRRHKQHV